MKIGLKLWSHNDKYADKAVALFQDRYFDYIELYAVKGSVDKYADIWQRLDIPYIIHAPHSSHGLNLADREKKRGNLALISEAQRYADKLNAPHIIIHPGILGEHDSVKEQLLELNDKRVVIENKPYRALNGIDVCAGASPGEIRDYMSVSLYGFCLDVNHAVNYAFHSGNDYKEVLKDFSGMEPTVIHLSGMNKTSAVDKHLHLYEGDLDLNLAVDIIKGSGAEYWTIEAPKDSSEGLDDFRKDVDTLRAVYE